MKVLRRTVIGLTAVVLGLGVNAGPVTATVGQRIASGDGDSVGRCLDQEGAGTGLILQMWECNGGRHQDWEYFPRPDKGSNVYQIRNRKSGWCVSAIYGNNWPRVASVEPCSDGHLDHFWIKENHTSTWHSWRNHWYRDQCLDVKDNGTSRTVQTWDCLTHQGNQRWKMY